MVQKNERSVRATVRGETPALIAQHHSICNVLDMAVGLIPLDQEKAFMN